MPRKSLILAGLLLAGCASAPRVERPQSLSVRLMVSPLHAFAPAAVYARLVVHDPLLELVCPEWSIDWGEEGTPSAWSSTCDPEAAALLHVEPREGPRRHWYAAPGEYVIRGCVTGQGVHRETAQTVTVIGRAE